MDAAARQRLRKLEIGALRLVDGRFLGEWSSNVRGQGLDFQDLREYVPGDDVRHLDWKATARSGRPQLRRFAEDRQQNIWLAIDLSASMAGAKAELARELLAVLGWAAIKQSDRFGVLGFTDRVEIHRPPARGEAQLWASLEDIIGHEAASPKTSLRPVWDFCSRQLGHRSTIVVVSDFRAELSPRALGALTGRHELLAFRVADPRDEGRLAGRLALVTDGETGERSWVDFSRRGMGRKLAEEMSRSGEELRREFRRRGAWYAEFRADRDFLPPLMEFFHRRREAMGA
jgi:uncharacterized protein (DUF58 family)